MLQVCETTSLVMDVSDLLVALKVERSDLATSGGI